MANGCECGDKTFGSIKCGEFLDWLENGLLLKKDSCLYRVCGMELLNCSNQNVITSCIFSYIEGKYVQMVQKCGAYL
jgi:hypothetical protein